LQLNDGAHVIAQQQTPVVMGPGVRRDDMLRDPAPYFAGSSSET
jgi:hypothetical protein